MRRIVPLLLVVLAGLPAFGDNLHFVNSFIGERAAGLGGAYTAVSDGPEGAYYNPAGLSFTSARYFSLSTNAFQFKRLTYQDIWKGSDPKVNYVRDSLLFVPNFFGFIQRAGETTFAFTISIPDNESIDQREKVILPALFGVKASGSSSYTDTLTNEVLNVNFVHQNTVTEAGPSFSQLLTSQLSLGGSLFLTYKDRKYINQNVITVYRQDNGAELPIFQTTSAYSRDRTVGLRPQLGLQYMPTSQVSFGACLGYQTPLWAVYDDQLTRFNYTGDAIDLGGSSWQFAPTVQDNIQTVSNILTNGLFENGYGKFNVGTAVFPTRSLLFSADVTAYVPVKGNGTRAFDQQFTWNAAAGMEWYASPNFPLRAGIFTDNANTPVVSADGINQNDHVDLYGASLSFGYSTAQSSITIGGYGTVGRGGSQIIANQTGINVLDAFSANIYLSGGYQF